MSTVLAPPGALITASVTIDGTPVSLGDVLADLTIHHGRTGFFDAASASTCQLTLLGVDKAFSRAFKLGALLVVNASDGVTTAPRFTGRFTDALLAEDTLTAIAVGRLRTLSGYTVGAVAYPSETWSARVTRVFTEAGLAGILDLPASAINPVLAARLAEPVDLADYLDGLGETVQSAVADRPDGTILVQAIGARSLSGGAALDPAEVQYAPSWTQKLPGANIVTVAYGDAAARASVTVQDALSVALYGPIAEEFDTEILGVADATAMGNARLTRDAFAHWRIESAPLIYGRRFDIGQPLTLSGMPPGSPYDPWTPFLEGWTDQIVSDGEQLTWTMELALSDPLLSGLALPWNTVPVAEKWDTIIPTTAWLDAVTLDSL